MDAPRCSLAPGAALLRAEGVTLEYRSGAATVRATENVSFEMHRGDRLVLLGPSGCGKSTLLKAIAGFITPRAGSLTLDGRPIVYPGPDRIVVFQEFDQLPPWKTVKGNVMFPLLAGGMGKAGAQALAMQPAILLMDEPFAALDALTRRSMQEELHTLWEEIRFTMLFVTHSIEEALVVGNRIVLLSPHPGRVSAELNSHQFDLGSAGGEAFQAAAQRIHRLLFDEDTLAAPAQAALSTQLYTGLPTALSMHLSTRLPTALPTELSTQLSTGLHA
ncbi:ABC transporter ATP-binding protein [Massilia genomosp. 1]|uniref:ATP-binding cassette domain-containing protein n=1 Tax=Massilia genomosp. 1 TaxID=2609280 RepID=A0ABX0MT67_9BURK|nr:ATP-binding cassette domain-containing protein [Massilia genomosp. 1]NHZ63546.1 ATP-binding cassette domain-containing protein [Massilia genomosp. 1]